MIVLARLVDPDFRAIRKDYEDNLSAPLTQAPPRSPRRGSRFTAPRSIPMRPSPCAFHMAGCAATCRTARRSRPLRRIAGLFERATGAPPFMLPETWVAAQPALNMGQAMNFCHR